MENLKTITKVQLLEKINLLESELADLKQIQETNQIIADNTSDNIAITTFDLKAKYLFINPSVKQMLGYEPEELVGKSFFDFIHPDDKKKLFPLLKKYISQIVKKILRIDDPNLSETVEYRFKDKAGNWHHLQSTINFVGKNLLSISRDITYNKEQEDNLRLSETKFKAILNAMDDMVFVLDQFNRFISFYASDKQLFVKPENFLGKTHSDVMPPHLNALFEKVLPDLKQGKTASYEYQMEMPEGLLWFSLKLSPLMKNENYDGLVGVVQEITKRKHSDEKLLEERNKLNTILNSLDDGVYIVDELYNIQYINPIIIKEFGPVNKRKCYEYFHGEKEICSFCKNKEVFAGKSLKWEWYSARSNKHYDLFDAPIEYIPGTISKFELFRDITKRKNAEKELKKLSTAVEQSANTIVITDTEGYIEYTNPKFTELTGYTAEEALGQNPRILNAGTQSKQYYSEMWKTISVGNIWKGEFHNKRKDGSLFWENVTISPIKNDEGIITNYLAVKEDITEQKQAETELKEALTKAEENETKLKEAQAIVHLGNWEFDLVNDKLTWSDEIYRIFDLRPQQFEATYEDFLEKIHPDDRQRVDKAYKNSLITKEPYEIEHRLLLNNDEVKYVLEKCRTEFDKKGKALHSIGIIQDISAQKKIETELERSLATTQQERNMFITGPVVAFKWRNTDGWPVEYVSPNATDLFGYSIKELTSPSLPYSKLILSEDIERVFKEVAENNKIGTESFIHQPYRIKRKDGSLIWVADYTTILRNKAGEITHYLGYILDISDYKKAERNLKKALVKAEESDRLKTAFLQNISHEIRTPMNGILGFSGLLKDPLLTGDEQQEYVDLIMISGHRMTNTLNDLMDISMLETDQVECQLAITNINDKLDGLLDFFLPEVKSKGIKFKLNKDLPTNEANIETDPQKLYAILANLIKNAIKYSDSGSIEFGYLKKGKHLEFYIKDDGIGIPKNRRKAIFDRFVQADIEDVKVFEGSGLGLSISKAYVEMLGGKIWVKSEEGKGSQFYFTIPYNREEEIFIKSDKKGTGKSISEIIDKLKILIAEDEEVTDKYLSIILKDISKTILHAKTGNEVVKLCKENTDIDLILMDIKMPIMDGYDATRRIRKFNKDVIIIAQTASALSGDKEKAIKAGCNDYISKPVNVNQLMQKIKNQLNKS